MIKLAYRGRDGGQRVAMARCEYPRDVEIDLTYDPVVVNAVVAQKLCEAVASDLNEAPS